MTFFRLINKIINDTRVAMLLLTKIEDPQLGNPRGTLLKQADQNRTGPYWEEMWTISGNPHGLHMKQMDKIRIGPIWVAHCSYGVHIVAQMGPMWDHVFVLTWFKIVF